MQNIYKRKKEKNQSKNEKKSITTRAPQTALHIYFFGHENWRHWIQFAPAPDTVVFAKVAVRFMLARFGLVRFMLGRLTFSKSFIHSSPVSPFSQRNPKVQSKPQATAMEQNSVNTMKACWNAEHCRGMSNVVLIHTELDLQ